MDIYHYKDRKVTLSWFYEGKGVLVIDATVNWMNGNRLSITNTDGGEEIINTAHTGFVAICFEEE